MGWGTQPLRIQLRLLTFQFSCLPYLGGTCRPSGAKCDTIGDAVSIVGERFPRPMGWGTQPLRIQLRLLTFQFSCLPYPGATCRPSGAKCGRICGAVSIVGERFPRPAGWGTQPLRMQLRLLTFQFSCLPYPGGTCRPSGAKCGTNWRRGIVVGERLPRPMGWGTQPLRIQLRLLTFQFSCLPYPGATCRPSGAKCGRIGGAVSIVGVRSPLPTGWGTQPLRMQIRLLTFQFLCLPYPASLR